ncbi:hypothetical protein Prudu_012471, partial [Prunus dulcis]
WLGKKLRRLSSKLAIKRLLLSHNEYLTKWENNWSSIHYRIARLKTDQEFNTTLDLQPLCQCSIWITRLKGEENAFGLQHERKNIMLNSKEAHNMINTKEEQEMKTIARSSIHHRAIFFGVDHEADRMIKTKESDCMIKTKEWDCMMGYIPSLYTLWAKAYR